MRLFLFPFIVLFLTPGCIEPEPAPIRLDSSGPSDAVVVLDIAPAEVDSADEDIVTALDTGDAEDAAAEVDVTVPVEVIDSEVTSGGKYLLTSLETEMTFFPGQGLRKDFSALVEVRGDASTREPAEEGLSVLLQRRIGDGTWESVGRPFVTDGDGVVSGGEGVVIGSNREVQFRLVVEETLTGEPDFLRFTARPTAMVHFATSATHSCAATKDELFCWGYNGQPPDGSGPRPMTDDIVADGRSVPTTGHARVDSPRMIPLPALGGGMRYTLPAGAEIVAIAVTDGPDVGGELPDPATCISIKSSAGPTLPLDGIWCVGSDNNNQLANGDAIATTGVWAKVQSGPVATRTPLASAESLVAGSGHFCAVVLNGTEPRVYCWGGNGVGQVAGWQTINLEVVTTVDLPHAFWGGGDLSRVTLDAGPSISCAHKWTVLAGKVINEGTYCWGDNSVKQIDPNHGASRLDPTHFTTDSLCELNQFQAIQVAQRSVAFAVGGKHVCTANGLTPLGITTNEAAAACGDVSPEKVRLACSGSNAEDQLGVVGTPARVPVWAKLADVSLAEDGSFFTQLSAGDAFTCGITKLGQLYCWGASKSGQLGPRGNIINNAISSKVFNDGAVSRVWATAKHACALQRTSTNKDGPETLHCWGDNTFGQSGTGCVTEAHAPRCMGAEPREIVLR